MTAQGADLQAAQGGDAEAFCRLVDLHQEMVRAYVAGYVGDREAAFDVAQEVFMVAHRKLDQFRADSDFAVWLRGIARHEALMHLRSRARRQHHEQAAGVFLAEQRQRAAEAGEEPPQLAQVRACMERLAKSHADAHALLRMRYHQAVPIGDMARSLASNAGAIRTRLVRARRLVAECIERHAAELP